MVWDEKLQRYTIEGVDQSDDDIPEPPPMAIKKKDPEPKKEAPMEGGAADLTKPAFAGALANRGRGRGARGGRGAKPAGRGGAMSAFNPGSAPRMPPVEEQKTNVSDASKMAELEKSRVDPALFTTAVDISVSQLEEVNAGDGARASVLSIDPSPMKNVAP